MDSQTYAFPDRWMIRLGAYVVDGADTQVSVNSDVGLGTSIDYERDLGGDDSDTIPRIDAYYRFNARHRIDFTAFNVTRKGEKLPYLRHIDDCTAHEAPYEHYSNDVCFDAVTHYTTPYRT